ncbi:lipoprotein [Polynucleobacter sp. SHI8]|uniref:SCO family protein n=1 Tax=unclassified Polynucleobacter TaxID=2640945 RepID=UPI00249174A1|nr:MULTISPECIES: SCO family protein [unclassified Polynucleobacter]BDW12143.1 lipoprotein [Polynucleobacter sp. SHI2]BDW14591.1 lipoprotein [Polynucleobacter sp. SHI8]
MFKLKVFKLLLALFGALTLLVSCSQHEKFTNVDISGSTSFSPVFELQDHHGQVRHLEDFKGKVLVVFFGYTQCPDVCPSTMFEMKKVMELLGKDADQVQVAFITLDPDRDTLELLEKYVPSFDARFLGLRPQSPEALEKVVKGYKIFYQKVSGKDPKYYTIDHTAGSYVIDKKGQLRLFVKHNQGEKNLADDLKKLVRAN